MAFSYSSLNGLRHRLIYQVLICLLAVCMPSEESRGLRLCVFFFFNIYFAGLGLVVTVLHLVPRPGIESLGLLHWECGRATGPPGKARRGSCLQCLEHCQVHKTPNLHCCTAAHFRSGTGLDAGDVSARDPVPATVNPWEERKLHMNQLITWIINCTETRWQKYRVPL